MINPFGESAFDGGFMSMHLTFFLIILLWSIFWKGLALWHSARRGQYGWFIVVLLINTLGILELAYLFLILQLTSRNLFTADVLTASSSEHTRARQDDSAEETTE